VIADQVAAERALLVQTLRAIGPDAPTLASGWRAMDVARHLAAQDRMKGLPAFVARRIVAATGLRLTQAYLGRRRVGALINGRPRAWNECLGRLDRPPPAAVLRPPVDVITLWEHVVHHEDVRRPSGISRPSWPDLSPVISWLLSYNGSRLRDLSVRILTHDGREWWAGEGTSLTVRGEPGELVLWLSGRATQCDVVVTGDAADLESLSRRMAI
jgi:uncharacterized protein (TIGR03085 family)